MNGDQTTTVSLSSTVDVGQVLRVDDEQIARCAFIAWRYRMLVVSNTTTDVVVDKPKGPLTKVTDDVGVGGEGYRVEVAQKKGMVMGQAKVSIACLCLQSEALTRLF